MSNRIHALTVLIAVFLLGGLCGAALVHFWAPGYRDGRDYFGAVPGQGRPDRLVELLQLNSEQQVQLKAIYADLRRQIDASRSEMGAKFDAIRAQANSRIAAMLNDEQKKKFEQFIKNPNLQRGFSGRRGGREGRGSSPH